MKNTNLKIGKLALFIDNTSRTYKVGAKGEVKNVAYLFGSMSKGEARKLRKLLHSMGFGHSVAVPRINTEETINITPAKVKKAAA